VATAYRIRDATQLFETHESRKYKHLSWVAVPNKHDGKGFRRLLKAKDGPLYFGAWILMLQVASKCPNRWTLADESGPLTPTDLEIKTDCPAEVFAAAIKRLLSPEIGWLELVTTPDPEPTPPATPPEEPSPPEIPPPAEPVFLTFPCNGKRGTPKEYDLTEPKVQEYEEAFPAVNVRQQLRNLRQWCIDNPSRRKTHRGMPAFLSRNLGRKQDEGGMRSESSLPATRPLLVSNRISQLAREQEVHGKEPGFKEYAQEVLAGKTEPGTWEQWRTT
jgi:hypothetical protein